MLLTNPDGTIVTYWGRPVQIGDVPAFNLDDRDFIVTDLDGWESVPKPDAVFVPNGGGAGVVATGRWLAQEGYLTVSGAIMAEPGEQAAFRRMLLAAVDPASDHPIIVYGIDEPDLQVFGRLYDKPEFSRCPTYMEFTLPLLLPDPRKYALQPLQGQFGAFTGQAWYRQYALTSASRWTRRYVLAGTPWVRSYGQLVDASAYPESLGLTSDGDTSSQRLTISVVGPLDAGEWWLLNESTGDRLWGEFGLSAAQTLTIDCQAHTANLNGADVSYAMFGDWLTLNPGLNIYRLVAGSPSAAFASLTALEAYR